jgi:hypothetical protein
MLFNKAVKDSVTLVSVVRMVWNIGGMILTGKLKYSVLRNLH